MKKYIKLAAISLILVLSAASLCLANDYSPRAIQMYNIGASYQNQGKYELAIKQYNMALQVQPDLIEAKHNLAVLYGNLAIRESNQKNYITSISYAKKSLQINPKDINVLTILGNSYIASNDSNNAIIAYRKILAIDADNVEIMHALAQTYIKQKQYEKAAPLYKKILTINPSDKVALQNTQYVQQEVQDKALDSGLQSVSICEKAPPSVYALLKQDNGVSSASIENAKYILDLIWSDPTGRLLLTSLAKSKVPINITHQIAKNANATRVDKQNTFYLYGVIPVFSYNRSKLCVNIPEAHVQNFMNTQLPANQRLFSLHAFIHEFCHAYRNINYPNAKNSIEEELGASMIGFNVSYKIVTGNYLTLNQTKHYSIECFKSLLSDSHRDLPVYGGFQNYMMAKGILMPYPDVYVNIVLMYKKLLTSGSIAPASTFAKYMY